MPIKINLLAEARAAEEMRRRDPVKRAMIFGGLLVGAFLVWSAAVEVNTIVAKETLARVNGEIKTRTATHDSVVFAQKKNAAARAKLDQLQRFSAARFLQGNLLNALQQATVDGVQLTRLHVDQTYLLTEGTQAQTNSDNTVVAGKASTVRERITLSLDAKDSGANPGDQMNKFKEALTGQIYFKSALSKTNGIRLMNLSPPEVAFDGKPFVLFSIECHYNDQTR
jgi:hypothetical protein